MAGTGVGFYRHRKGIKQADLARLIGTDPGRMSRIESGAEIPSAIEVDRLVSNLDVPPTWLFSTTLLREIADRARADVAQTSTVPEEEVPAA